MLGTERTKRFFCVFRSSRWSKVPWSSCQLPATTKQLTCLPRSTHSSTLLMRKDFFPRMCERLLRIDRWNERTWRWFLCDKKQIWNVFLLSLFSFACFCCLAVYRERYALIIWFCVSSGKARGEQKVESVCCWNVWLIPSASLLSLPARHISEKLAIYFSALSSFLEVFVLLYNFLFCGEKSDDFETLISTYFLFSLRRYYQGIAQFLQECRELKGPQQTPPARLNLWPIIEEVWAQNSGLVIAAFQQDSF